jgi:hypothetical protein
MLASIRSLRTRKDQHRVQNDWWMLGRPHHQIIAMDGFVGPGIEVIVRLAATVASDPRRLPNC